MKLAIIFSSIVVLMSGLFSGSVQDSRPLAIVRRAKPDLWVKHKNTEWKAPGVAEQLFSGDSIKTGAEGYAAIQFMDNSLVKIKSNSILAIVGEVRGKDNTASRLAVSVGEVFLNVTKQKSDFEVGTPSAVAAVKGTKGNTKVNSAGDTDVEVLEGVFLVTSTSTGQAVTAKRGTSVNVKKQGGGIEQKKLTKQQIQSTNQGYNKLDNQAKPKKMKLRFVNKEGTPKEVEVEYFEQNAGN